jgi:SOUL heme-binding protein
MQTPDLETPEYTILYKSPDFEVRKYASYLVAETPMARGAGPNSGSGFNELAGYIFGGNQDSQSLEMTTPVFSKPASKASDSPTMQFVMERRFSSPESLPKPTGSAKISPKVEQGGILAATTFSGWPLDTEARPCTRCLYMLRSTHAQTRMLCMHAGGGSGARASYGAAQGGAAALCELRAGAIQRPLHSPVPAAQRSPDRTLRLPSASPAHALTGPDAASNTCGILRAPPHLCALAAPLNWPRR